MRRKEDIIETEEQQTSFCDNSILVNSTLALSPNQDTQTSINEHFSDDSTVSVSSSVQSSSQTPQYFQNSEETEITKGN